MVQQLLRFHGGNLCFPEIFCIFLYLLLVILWYKYQKKISLPWEREGATE